ncbi:hypothetical protein cypCar_00048919 [Cyprinus carpio]|nr:hypothetical protein cypCar_00048919 [Cyprinus carpio]
MAESTEMDQLLTAFKKFAVHGDTKATGKEMNGKNWAKLCKDCKVIDSKNVTSTDVDIVFTKVKAKTSRVITYEEFQKALEELAPKRFKNQSKEEALQSIYKLIEGKEPANVGVTVSQPFENNNLRYVCMKMYENVHINKCDYTVQGGIKISVAISKQ